MTRLALSFFGTFEVNLKEQPITRFRSANNQGLLVYLALNRDKALPREVLATLFWPEETEKNARHNLRQALYHLRKLLGDTKNAQNPFLIVTRQTVRFNPISDFELDVERFFQAIESNELETAVTHYHGELLPGFTCDSLQFEDWLRQERESLHQLALEAMSEVTQDHLSASHLDQAQAVARRQLSLEPWREVAFRQLMQAYAMASDRGNALAQFKICRTVLWEELGIEPAAETVALYKEIEAGRFGGIRTDETVLPPVKVKHNLPATTTKLIGRELELDQISRLFTHDRRRLVTIIGPGGMGKTRLALAVGTDLLKCYPDGVYFVDLASLSAANEINFTIATALDYQAPDWSQDIGPQLLTSLHQRQLLLILDNFEHLLAGATLVNDLLQACPSVAVLVTSRQGLNLASESRYELGGLQFPKSPRVENVQDFTAVQLFLDSGRRIQSQFSLDPDNVVEVVKICQLVQGMPLGLMLAAAWLKLLAPGEIAKEIETSLDFLAADLADLPARQRSILAVFQGSWGLLAPDEQEVLAKLSIFRGGFSREAAGQVAGANLRVLLSLVNKSILQRDVQNGRFAIHELLRQFAAFQRRKVGANEQIGRIHCRYFSGLVRLEVQRTLTVMPPYVPKKLAENSDNIRRAWAYAVEQGLAEELSDLAGGMIAFNYAQGTHPGILLQQARQALQLRGVPNTNRNMLHLQLLALKVLWGNEEISHVRRRFLEFLPIAEEQGYPELRYWVYDQLGHIFNAQKDLKALDWVHYGVLAAKETGDEIIIKRAEAAELWLRVDLGQQESSALARLRGILDYLEPNFPTSEIIYGLLWTLSTHCLSIDEHELAIAYGKKGQEVVKGWQNLFWINHAAHNLADIYIDMGLPAEARYQLLDALEWHIAIGQDWQVLGFLLGNTIFSMHLMGNAETAVQILSMVYYHPESVPMYRQMIDNAGNRLKTELGPEAYTAAWEKGKEMDIDTAVAQMRAALELEE